MTSKTALLARWTERAKGAALVGALAIAAASGYAFAISPTIETGRTYLGNVNFTGVTVQNEFEAVYVVPADRTYTVTDVIFSNLTGSEGGGSLNIAADGNCSQGPSRIAQFAVPPGDTVHLPLVTGVGFGPGKTVCVNATGTIHWTLRGFLSNG